MSGTFGRQPSDAAYDTRLSGRDRRVLHDLCNHAGKAWTCRRKQSEIAKAISSDRKGVNRSLKRLEELGYVAVVEAKGRSLTYRVIVAENSGGQSDLFERAEQVRQAKPIRRIRKSVAKRGHMAPSDVPVEAPSEGAAKPTPIEQTSFNRGPIGPAAPREAGAGSIHQSPANDLDPPFLPDAVPGQGDPSGLALADRLRKAAGPAINAAHPAFLSLAEPYGWLAAGCDLEADIVPVLAGVAARHAGAPVRSWRYFAGAITEARDRRLAASKAGVALASVGTRPARLKSVGDRLADAMARVARGEEAFPSHDERTSDVVALGR